MNILEETTATEAGPRLKWEKKEFALVISEVKRLALTGVEYSFAQLFAKAQKVLPLERRRDEWKGTVLATAVKKYKAFKATNNPENGKPADGRSDRNNYNSIKWTPEQWNAVFTSVVGIQDSSNHHYSQPDLLTKAQKVLLPKFRRPWSSATACGVMKDFKKWKKDNAKAGRAAPVPLAAPFIPANGLVPFKHCPDCTAAVKDPDANFCSQCSFNFKPFKK